MSFYVDSARVHFVIPFVPVSKKNGTMIVKGKSGRSFVIPGKKVREQEKAIRALAIAAGAREGTADAQQEWSVHITWDVKKSCVYVTAFPFTPLRKIGRRRDMANMPEVILDALNRLVYADDSQVRALVVEAVHDAEDVEARLPGWRKTP